MFCEKCGTLLVPQEKSGKRMFYCRKCKRYKDSSVKINQKINNEEERIVLVREKKINLPKIEKNCSKCQNKKAYFWIEQTRSSDEAPTRFHKCTKCGHVWREYH